MKPDMCGCFGPHVFSLVDHALPFSQAAVHFDFQCKALVPEVLCIEPTFLGSTQASRRYFVAMSRWPKLANAPDTLRDPEIVQHLPLGLGDSVAQLVHNFFCLEDQ